MNESCLRRVDDDVDDDNDGDEFTGDDGDDDNDDKEDATAVDDDIIIFDPTTCRRCDETASTFKNSHYFHPPHLHNSPPSKPAEFPPISGVSISKPKIPPTLFVCKNGTSFE